MVSFVNAVMRGLGLQWLAGTQTTYEEGGMHAVKGKAAGLQSHSVAMK